MFVQSTDFVQDSMGNVVTSKPGSKLQQGEKTLMLTHPPRKAVFSHKPGQMPQRGAWHWEIYVVLQ